MNASDLTFLHGAAYPRYSYRIDKHFNGYHALQFMQAGALRIAYGQQEQLLEGPWVWPTYPGPRIAFGPDRPNGWWNHRYLAFSGPRIQRWQADGIWCTIPHRIDHPDDLARRFDLLLAYSRRDDRIGQMRAINLLEGILLELAEQRQLPEQREAWLQTVLDALEPGPTKAPGLDALARRAAMPASTLRRRFKQAMGMSLSDYTVSLRISRACDLLTETTRPIGQVAAHLGYSDIYFFSRQFRQRTGLTPSAYRSGNKA